MFPLTVLLGLPTKPISPECLHASPQQHLRQKHKAHADFWSMMTPKSVPPVSSALYSFDLDQASSSLTRSTGKGCESVLVKESRIRLNIHEFSLRGVGDSISELWRSADAGSRRDPHVAQNIGLNIFRNIRLLRFACRLINFKKSRVWRGAKIRSLPFLLEVLCLPQKVIRIEIFSKRRSSTRKLHDHRHNNTGIL